MPVPSGLLLAEPPLVLALDALVIGSWVMQTLAVVWVLCLGCSVGSFLNVVIYRLPRGLSLVHPPSRCPVCEQPIQWKHNIPVFGWARLGGRCADCRTPIPIRYPLVEALTGFVFALLYVVDVASGGAHLPASLSLIEPRFPETVWDVRAELVVLCLQHWLLASLLIAGTMMTWDAQAIPRKLIVIAPALLIAVGLFHNSVPPLPIGWTVGPRADYPLDLSVRNVILGGFVGGFVGVLLWVTRWEAELSERSANVIWMAVWVGLTLGYQGALGVGLVAAFLRTGLGQFLALAKPIWRRVPVEGWLSVAVLIWLPLWTFLAPRNPPTLIFHALLLILAAVLGRWLADHLPDSPARTASPFWEPPTVQEVTEVLAEHLAESDAASNSDSAPTAESAT